MDDITLNVLNSFSNLVINTFYFLKWLFNLLRLWSAAIQRSVQHFCSFWPACTPSSFTVGCVQYVGRDTVGRIEAE